MAITDKNRGTFTALTVTNLQSLGDGAHWQSAGINAGGALEVELEIVIATTTTAGSATGVAEIRIARRANTAYAGGASGSEGSYTEGGDNRLELMDLVASMVVPADETTARTFRRVIKFDDPSEFFAIVITNSAAGGTGTGFASSGCSVGYRLNDYETV